MEQVTILREAVDKLIVFALLGLSEDELAKQMRELVYWAKDSGIPAAAIESVVWQAKFTTVFEGYSPTGNFRWTDKYNLWTGEIYNDSRTIKS